MSIIATAPVPPHSRLDIFDADTAELRAKNPTPPGEMTPSEMRAWWLGYSAGRTDGKEQAWLALDADLNTLINAERQLAVRTFLHRNGIKVEPMDGEEIAAYLANLRAEMDAERDAEDGA